ncbi:MAG: hypothetical protein PHT89_06750 [Lachnospiraceae bacterium]|nr:hypothetical protein [Lachnospiraceae bacterium]MDD3660408.1 hypothetical protein [Lachnospiraceae bacterium]
MSNQEIELLNRINQYAETVLADIDPQKTQISVQLEKLKPVMSEIAAEQNKTVEEVFIQYMDLASVASLKREQDFKNEHRDSLKNLANSDFL